MKLPKQLQPSQQERRDSCSSTHSVSFLSHTFCSAQPPSSPLVSISCGIGLNKGLMWRLLFGGLGRKWNSPQGDLKAVTVEGGREVSRGFDGVMDWCHSGQTCSAEVMISSRWWKRRNSNLFWVLFFSSSHWWNWKLTWAFCSVKSNVDLWSPLMPPEFNCYDNHALIFFFFLKLF